MEKTKIFIAGHRGMLGSALIRALEAADAKNLVAAKRDIGRAGDDVAGHVIPVIAQSL